MIETVDGLIQCNRLVGNYESQKFVASQILNVSKSSSMTRSSSSSRQYFPLKKGTFSVMTLRVGEEGIQMTVDGRHMTSFAHREVIKSLCFSVSVSCLLLACALVTCSFSRV